MPEDRPITAQDALAFHPFPIHLDHLPGPHLHYIRSGPDVYRRCALVDDHDERFNGENTRMEGFDETEVEEGRDGIEDVEGAV